MADNLGKLRLEAGARCLVSGGVISPSFLVQNGGVLSRTGVGTFLFTLDRNLVVGEGLAIATPLFVVGVVIPSATLQNDGVAVNLRFVDAAAVLVDPPGFQVLVIRVSRGSD